MAHRRKHLLAANNIDARSTVSEQAPMDVVDGRPLSGGGIPLCALRTGESVGTYQFIGIGHCRPYALINHLVIVVCNWYNPFMVGL